MPARHLPAAESGTSSEDCDACPADTFCAEGSSTWYKWAAPAFKPCPACHRSVATKCKCPLDGIVDNATAVCVSSDGDNKACSVAVEGCGGTVCSVVLERHRVVRGCVDREGSPATKDALCTGEKPAETMQCTDLPVCTKPPDFGDGFGDDAEVVRLDAKMVIGEQALNADPSKLVAALEFGIASFLGIEVKRVKVTGTTPDLLDLLGSGDPPEPVKVVELEIEVTFEISMDSLKQSDKEKVKDKLKGSGSVDWKKKLDDALEDGLKKKKVCVEGKQSCTVETLKVDSDVSGVGGGEEFAPVDLDVVSLIAGSIAAVLLLGTVQLVALLFRLATGCVRPKKAGRLTRKADAAERGERDTQKTGRHTGATRFPGTLHPKKPYEGYNNMFRLSQEAQRRPSQLAVDDTYWPDDDDLAQSFRGQTVSPARRRSGQFT